MLKNWRTWVLAALLIGPIAAYIGLGFLWLNQRGWVWVTAASAAWIITGIVFTILAARWTKEQRQLLPPLDWDAPETFAPHDRKAWELVQQEADGGDAVALEELTNVDLYIDTGKRLARRLAAHYEPLSTDPIQHVPVVELLTALELATDDLNRLCRQVPGGDLITPAHWKQAVQVAGYIQKANDIYSYLLPIVQPLTGLPRLAARKFMVEPAWKNMQQNLLRWFFRAYVNRLGSHLIELYSHRLVIGAEQYRRLTRRGLRTVGPVEAEVGPLRVAVAGAKGVGRKALIEALDRARKGNLATVRARLEAAGLDEEFADRLAAIEWVEVPAYTVHSGGEAARDRATRRAAVADAVEADLLILAVDVASPDIAADLKFLEAWQLWYRDHPDLEAPPVLVVVVGADRPELGGPWKPPHDWARGQSPRESAVRARVDTLRAALPAPGFAEVAVAGLGQPPAQGPNGTVAPEHGVAESALPALAVLLHRAERVAVIRHLHDLSARSKARRLFTQLGKQGRRLLAGTLAGRK